MHYFKIQGFISNDEAFQEMKRIGEPDVSKETATSYEDLIHINISATKHY